MQYLAKCDLIVYDLHFGNPEDVKLALKALSKPAAEGEERPAETILILISSLLAWDKTPKNLQELVNPTEAKIRAAAAAEAEALAAKEANADGDAENEDEDKEEKEEAVMS